MSDSGFKAVGRPDATLDGGFIYYQYCGGKGGGGCLDPLGVTGVVIAYRVPRFIVRNRRLLFENKEWNGVRIYTDGGAVFLCDHSLGSEAGFYMALSADGQLTDEEVVQRGQFLTGALPYDIEFLAKDIPQPAQGANWLGYIFVHLYWGNTGYLNEGGAIDQYSMRIKKHDYDIQV